MIVIAPSYILRFIDFLNYKYETKHDCKIEFYNNDKCIQYKCDGKGNCDKCKSLAEYDKDTMTIHLPTQYSPDKNPSFILESLAHEFWHHVQNCEGRLIDENRDILEIEAERKCKEIVKNYLNI